MSKRIIFLGSSEFGMPILDALHQKYQLSAVITQPDRLSGRGGKITYSPIKNFAKSLGIPVLQPEKINHENFISQLIQINPDLFIVAAYGQILSKKVLEIPTFGCINVHASLLPRWRGASPIQSAILAGDDFTGVTIMMMDEGVDTGPILSQRTIPIDKQDTGLSLSTKLSKAGADLLVETLDKYFDRQIQPMKQNEQNASISRLLKKSDGLLDFNKPAVELERMVRAFYPWPGTFFLWDEILIKVVKAHVSYELPSTVGEHKIIQKEPAIGTGDGLLVLDSLQPEGRKLMAGSEFLNGARNWSENDTKKQME